MPATDVPLHVVHTMLSLQAATGGPVRVVTALCEALSRCGCRVDLTTVDWGRSFGREMIPVDTSRVNVHVQQGLLWPWPRLWLVRGFRKRLRRIAAEARLIHVHGIWISMSKDAAAIAVRMGIPYVMTIHGVLAPQALRISAWKKRLARWLYVNRNLRQAACLHATSPHELKQIRDFGLTNPVAVIPNGVHLAEFDALPPRDEAESRWPELTGKKLVLFLGRLHPIKGLDYLVGAWCRLAGRFGDWHLVVAGPDEVGLQARLEEMLRRRGAAESVTFTGPVYGRQRLGLLGACGLLAQPSRSENFGMSVAEALAASKPVVTTVTMPWDDVVTHRCGWQVEVGTDPLTEVLTEALASPEAALTEMGRRGRKLVETKYTWDAVAAQMMAVYRWLVDGGSPPDCVVLDGKGSHAD